MTDGPPTPPPADRQAWEAATPTRRRWPVLVAGAGLLIGAVIVASGPADDGITVADRHAGPPGDGQAPSGGDEVVDSRDGDGPAGRGGAVGGGRWVRHAAAPISLTADAAGAWTGEELVVIGDRGQAAAYDPEERRWRRMPPRPSARPAREAVWTGAEVVVWSPPASAAAYDPEGDAWRGLPTPPALEGAATLVWSGETLILWGLERAGTTPVGMVLDPADGDDWSPLPAAPMPPLTATTAVWADHRGGGDQLLVWGERAGGDAQPEARGAAPVVVAGYDPADGAWRELSPPPVAAPAGLPAVWADSRLVMWGGDPRVGAGGAVLDPVGDVWTPLARLDPDERVGPVEARGIRPVWTGRFVLFPGAGSSRGDGLAYAPSRDVWQSMAPLRFASGAVNVWTGEHLLSWGGFDHVQASRSVRVWHPPDLGPSTPRLPPDSQLPSSGSRAW